MGDEATIREIISEVDTDNVSLFFFWLATILDSSSIHSWHSILWFLRMVESTMKNFVQWWGVEPNNKASYSDVSRLSVLQPRRGACFRERLPRVNIYLRHVKLVVSICFELHAPRDLLSTLISLFGFLFTLKFIIESTCNLLGTLIINGLA